MYTCLDGEVVLRRTLSRAELSELELPPCFDSAARWVRSFVDRPYVWHFRRGLATPTSGSHCHARACLAIYPLDYRGDLNGSMQHDLA